MWNEAQKHYFRGVKTFLGGPIKKLNLLFSKGNGNKFFNVGVKAI